MSRAVVSTPGGWIATALLTTFVVAASAAVATGLSMARAVALSLIAVGVAGAVAAASGRRVAGYAAGMVLAASAGLIRGSIAVPQAGGDTIAGHLGAGPVTLVGTVRESVAPAPAGRLVIDVSGLSTADLDQPVSGAVLVQMPPGAPLMAGPGDAVQVVARRLSPPGRRPGPRSLDALERLRISAIATGATVTLHSVAGPTLATALTTVRTRLAGGVDAILPEPAATLLLGIAFGLRRPLPADLTGQLQDAGLFHIVVVSGLKVIIVAGMVRAVATARQWSRRHRLAVATATVGCYVLVSGAGVAAVRSAAMGLAALSLAREGRRVDPLPLLGLIAAVMIGVDPLLWTDVGFLLSFLGTAGILLMADPIGRRLPGPRLIVEPFAVTIAAQVTTVPVMAGTFGVISLIGPVANALVLPLLPVLIVLGVVGAALATVSPAVGWLPLHLAGAAVDAAVLVGRVAAGLPGAAIHVAAWPPLWTMAELAGVAGAAIALAWRWRPGSEPPAVSRSGIAAAVAAGILTTATVLVVGSRPDGRLRVTVLDVGAAPAVLIRTGAGGLALVDGGSDPARLQTALGRVLPPTTHTIDLVVLTGGDRTGVAALAGLPGHYAVTTVLAPAGLGAGGLAAVDGLRAAGSSVSALDGRTWTWSGADWTCLPLGNPAPGGPACVLELSAPDGRALILGTALPSDQDELPALYGDRLATDLLVTQPGAVAPTLVSASRPHEVAVPSAARASTIPAAGASTGADGDLEYAGGGAGMRRQ